MSAALLGPSGLPYRPCAGVVLINPMGLVFAGQRIDNPGPAWQMPQGGLARGFALVDPALRHLPGGTGVVDALAGKDQPVGVDQHHACAHAIGQARRPQNLVAHSVLVP